MSSSARNVLVLARWEIRRFFELGGLKELMSYWLTGLAAGLVAGTIGEQELALAVVAVGALAAPATALHSFTKEKEAGILPALLSSPATAGDLLLGKFAGYAVAVLGCYWASASGAGLGLVGGLGMRDTAAPGGARISTLLDVALALTATIPAAVSATIIACWRAGNPRDAALWSFAGCCAAGAAGIALFVMSERAGTSALLVAAPVLVAATVLCTALYATRLSPEQALTRPAGRRRRRSRPRPGGSFPEGRESR